MTDPTRWFVERDVDENHLSRFGRHPSAPPIFAAAASRLLIPLPALPAA